VVRFDEFIDKNAPNGSVPMSFPLVGKEGDALVRPPEEAQVVGEVEDPVSPGRDLFLGSEGERLLQKSNGSM